MLLSRFILFAFRQTCQRGEEREYTGERRGGGDGDPVDISEQRRGAYGGNGGLRDGRSLRDLEVLTSFVVTRSPSVAYGASSLPEGAFG